MKAITELTSEEYKKYSEIYKILKEKTNGTSSENWFINLKRIPGYAHYKFEGEISNKLIELLGSTPTENEIIMLIDGGFSHFGAYCYVSGCKFTGKINTD